MTVGVTLVTRPKPEEELRGLVWGLPRREAEPERVSEEDRVWYRSPKLLGFGALALIVVLNIVFI